MKQILTVLPAFFAIAILICAPALGIFSFQVLVDFGLRQGVPPGVELNLAAFVGAAWEIALLIIVSKDLVRS